jgi:hypothetical protein
VPRLLFMNRLIVALRIPVACAALFVAFTLSVLYAVDIVLPSPMTTGIWIALGAVFFLGLRANEVPLLSLSSVCVAFYIYVAVMFFWPVLYPQVFIAVHSTAFQSSEIFGKANHLTAIGMAAFLTAWTLAFHPRTQRSIRSWRPAMILPVSGNAFPILILLSFPLLILSFPTANIFTAGYDGATYQAGASLQINVLKPALFICLLLAQVSFFERPTRLRKITLVVLFTTVISILGFASGNRVEELGCLFGIGWVIQSRRATKKMPRAWTAPAIFLGLFMLLLGEVRSVLPSQKVDTQFLIDALQSVLRVVPDNETLRMKPSTNGDIAVTLCVVIGMIDTGVLSVDHGATFWKYLEMTLPRFINPDRPVELQVFLQKLAKTGGGLFVLAEPYVSGGSLGVLIVLGFFGYCVGYLEVRYLAGVAGQWQYLLYLLLLSCTPRWFLYSILSMYKHVLTGLLIVLLVKIASRFVSRAHLGVRALGPLQA